MIVYRVPPFPLSASLKGLEPETEYTWSLIDEYSSELETEQATTDDEGTLTIEVPHEYDSDYVLRVSLGGNVKTEEHISIVRPYIDIARLMPANPTPEQYAKAQQQELVSRAIIDGFTNGFYRTKEFFETEGSGSDYLVIPYTINKILRVWESNELVYEVGGTENVYNFGISPDRTSIIHLGEADYASGRPIIIPGPSSDYGYPYGGRGSFPNGRDYVIEFETGPEFVPGVVSQCVKLLADDQACGSDYIGKYVLEYDTDQYRIKYSARALNGTGNKTVDMLLKPFRGYTVRAGLI